MILLRDALSIVFTLCGTAFFFAGTVGLLRFPDIYTRLHALAKADNLGLGLVVVGLAIRSPSLAAAIKLLAIWLLAMLASAAASHLMGQSAVRYDIEPWSKPT